MFWHGHENNSLSSFTQAKSPFKQFKVTAVKPIHTQRRRGEQKLFFFFFFFTVDQQGSIHFCFQIKSGRITGLKWITCYGNNSLWRRLDVQTRLTVNWSLSQMLIKYRWRLIWMRADQMASSPPASQCWYCKDTMTHHRQTGQIFLV